MSNGFKEGFQKLTDLAKQYGYAACVLNKEIHRQHTTPADSRPSVEHDAYSYLWVPSLQLSAHALECMVKACAYLNDVKPPRSAKDGHDLSAMLSQAYAELLRGRLFANAEVAANALRQDRAYDPAIHDQLGFNNPAKWVEVAISDLGKLHLQGGSKLRYGSVDPNEKAPSSPLLADAVYLTTQDLGRAKHLFANTPKEGV
ncbi:hypothetical protein FPY71_15860 [Aureimonas fodinaquatilis]|uniref:HEPN domain-containing protein n=1 Tax=Aureimonas fodinaquatilis TaxID=2565783 RepID=A0A5B0DR83_9HYPH|nr:hypothetical protein [Aureimonas fodinaquatilis]KAA0969026.1 hypothetical protein FPY71_15860 [Aureimonas fodinaquatilis]